MGCCESRELSPASRPAVQGSLLPPLSIRTPEPTAKPNPPAPSLDGHPKPLAQADVNTKVIASVTPYAVHLEAGTRVYYCTCGRSTSQPHCDGKHQGTPFSPLVFTANESKDFYMCGCKATLSTPLCDGSHQHLPTW